jgi:hypothetical protein
MKQPDSKINRGNEDDAESQLQAYVPPKIVTYTSEELLEQVGPALTCSPSPCTMTPATGSPVQQFKPKH